jgi:hypothetical protein
MFAHGKSTINLVLWEFLYVINVVCKIQIRWPKGEVLVKVVAGFKNLCDLPHVNGVIDITQIHIQKPRGPFVGDYLSIKSKGFNVHLEIVVDHWKLFRKIFVGMLGSMNDTHILWISSLYHKVVNGELF